MVFSVQRAAAWGIITGIGCCSSGLRLASQRRAHIMHAGCLPVGVVISA